MSTALGYVTVRSNPDKEAQKIRYDKFVALLFDYAPKDLMKLNAVNGLCPAAITLNEFILGEVKSKITGDKAILLKSLGNIRFFIQVVMNLYDVSEIEILQSNADSLNEKYRKYIDGST